MTTEDLRGRVAIVTGGARGIGHAIAGRLVAAGAAVVIADNGTAISGEGEDRNVAAAAAERLGSRAVPFAASIASPAAAAAVVELAVSRYGGLDIVVNNAAILRDAFIFKADPRDWDAVLENNLSAAYYMLSAATPVMRRQAKEQRGGESYEWGRIVNMASTAGLFGNFGQAAYASSKAGLLGLTRVVALDMARSGVTCNAVAPFAATRVTDSIKPANDAQADYKRRASRVATEHVAALVAWLCTNAASSVTGQLFGVRAREVFVFSQPRPVARLVRDAEWGAPAFGSAVDSELRPAFTDLTTDLEYFNTDPIE